MGFLKGRWSSLRGLRVKIDNSKGLQYACLWITACVHLHAFAMNHEDGQFYSRDRFFKDGWKYVKTQRQKEARWRRERRAQNAVEEQERDELQEIELLRGKIKWEELKEQLFEYLNRNEDME